MKHLTTAKVDRLAKAIEEIKDTEEFDRLPRDARINITRTYDSLSELYEGATR